MTNKLSYYDNCLFIINSNNQDLIHHIHCFGSIFYHQSKTKKNCWFHKSLFYDLYFESCSSNVSNISYSTKHLYTHYDLLLQQHFCFCLRPFNAHYYHLPKTNASLALIWQILQLQHQLFYLSFYQPLNCFNYHNFIIFDLIE